MTSRKPTYVVAAQCDAGEPRTRARCAGADADEITPIVVVLLDISENRSFCVFGSVVGWGSWPVRPRRSTDRVEMIGDPRSSKC